MAHIIRFISCVWIICQTAGALQTTTTEPPAQMTGLPRTGEMNLECEVNNCPNGDRCLRRQGVNVTDYVCECEIRPREQYGPTCDDTFIFFRSFDFFPCYGPQCSSGNFTTLNYPNNYKNRNSTMMLVYVPGASRFDFSFDKQAFQIEYGKDDLLVGRGLKPPISEIPSTIPDKEAITSAFFFHGYDIPEDFSIESDTFFIYWATDATVVFKGFSLSWTSVAIEVINCPSNITAFIVNGIDRIEVFWEPPEVKSGVGRENLRVESNYQPGQNFTNGRYTIEYTYEDDFHHQELCSFQLTVEAIEVINCPSNMTVLTVNGIGRIEVFWEPPEVKSVVGRESLRVESNYEPGQTFTNGRYTVEYTYEDDFHHQELCSFQLTVEGDDYFVNCPQSMTVTTCNSEEIVTWAPPMTLSSSQNNVTVESSHNPQDLFQIGTTTVSYTSTNQTGYIISTCTFQVTVRNSCSSMTYIWYLVAAGGSFVVLCIIVLLLFLVICYWKKS